MMTSTADRALRGSARLPAARRSRRPRRPAACRVRAPSARISPRRVNSFSSARSRTLQVLMTMTSASRSSVVGLVAGLLEQPRHPLGVVDVHLAAVRFDQVFHWLRLSRLGGFRFRLSPFIRLSPASSSSPASRARWRRPPPTRRSRQSSARAPPRVAPAARRVDAGRRSGPCLTLFAIRKCVPPYAAICGRCVMQSTWNRFAEALQPAADHVGDGAADAGVDLVEDERLAGRVGRRRASSARA